MEIIKLFYALCVHGKVIDLITSEGRTYQVNGDPRSSGVYERIFHISDNPSRRDVEHNEAQEALNKVTEIHLWTGAEEYRVVTEEQLVTELAPFPLV